MSAAEIPALPVIPPLTADEVERIEGMNPERQEYLVAFLRLGYRLHGIPCICGTHGTNCWACMLCGPMEIELDPPER